LVLPAVDTGPGYQ